ncbi:molybdopterin-guanine dinucleotide biosynthesis protein B [Hydrogenophaga sp. RWCD_12]|uniref:molybdopterin-guanine dinucleotide biosynthesis protein B n=1 Tax=Hydrogenophaga sp. RWCD_12 TaxID=3391190 RepID=UPI003985227F
MKVVGFAGFSGAGKTTLVEQLIPALRRRGLRVSVIKHAHKGLDVDHQGKDTWRHREAGAYEVLAVSPERLVLQRSFEQAGERTVHEVLPALHPGVDWVLVEGYRDSDLLKIEVWRPGIDRPARYPDDPFIVAIATDTPLQLPEPTLRPVLELNNADMVAAWLVDNGGRFDYVPEAYR